MKTTKLYINMENDPQLAVASGLLMDTTFSNSTPCLFLSVMSAATASTAQPSKESVKFCRWNSAIELVN